MLISFSKKRFQLRNIGYKFVPFDILIFFWHHLPACAFKYCNKILKLDFRTARFDWESELIIKAARRGLNMREVRIKSIYMNHHRSKIKVFSDTLRFFRLILSNIVY